MNSKLKISVASVVLSKTKHWMARFCLMSLPITTLMMTISLQPANAQPANAVNGCSASDCVHHEILQTQATCSQVGTESSPKQPVSSALGWGLGLNTEIDQNILQGNVIAYKVRWHTPSANSNMPNGNWSGWYVTGVNDLDIKFNTANNTMRRRWSYFNDHPHLYIICKP